MEQTATHNTTAPAEMMITQLLKAWTGHNKSVKDFFSKYDDAEYLNPVAPGRSRAIYLLGHLVAVSDAMVPLLGLGERAYPELEKPFLTSPDNVETPMPSVALLREYWDAVSATLDTHFASMTPQDWMGRHTRISEEDFAKEPMRNKLSILISRTNHTNYHLGQLVFLVKK
jgi:hypothetical protein